MAAIDVVDSYVSALPGRTRRLAHAEWGVSVEPEQVAGIPLDIGVRLADGLLRAQALAAPHDDALDPWLLLHWNRQTRLVRFACTRSGDIWVHGEIPAAGLDEVSVDRLLGLLVEGARVARRYAASMAAAT